jgi:MFS family permease
VAPAPGLARDQPTVLLYAALGVLGYLLNGLGAVLGPLQHQLQVDRAQVAFYPSLFAVALLAVGVLGGRAVQRLGHRTALVVALGGLAVGAGLLTGPTRLLTLAGAVVLGTGGALMVQVVPAALTRRHPTAAAPALGEANAVSSFASVLAPAAVAAAVGLGADWRIGYLLPVLPVAAGLLLLLLFHASLRAALQDGPVGGSESRAQPKAATGFEPGRLPGRWVDVLLAVSVEFCLVFWTADAFRDWHGAGPAAAPALAAAFLLGMALARVAAARLTTGRHPAAVVLSACGAAVGGFTAFWASPGTAAAAAGLLLTGAGVALLYPVTLARLVAAWPHARDQAAARGALASGLAIGAAPLLLARLADIVGLRAAYLVVPALLTALAAHAAITLTRTPRTPR